MKLAGIDQRGGNAGRLQRFERRQPVDAGAFHHRGLDTALAQPPNHLVKPARERLEGARVDLRLPAPGHAHAHRDGDLHLVHVKARGAGVDDVQRIGHHGLTSHLVGGRRRRNGAGRTGLTSVTECGAFCRASTTRGPGTIRGSEPTGRGQFGQRESTLTTKPNFLMRSILCDCSSGIFLQI